MDPSTPSAQRGPRTALAISAVLAVLLCGCQSYTEHAPRTAHQGTGQTLSLEPHDLQAAIAHISERFEIATLQTINEPSGAVEYLLISILDEPVTIRFDLPADPAPDTAVPALVTVRYGRFRNAEKEQAILSALKDRLAWLEHRD